MIKKIKSHPLFVKHKKYIRFIFFCFVGGTGFLLDWSFFNLFYHLIGNFVTSNILSWCIGVFYSFSVNRNITFSARGHCLKKQIPKWLFVYLIAFLVRISWGKALLFFVNETTLTANIATITGIIIAIPISFFGSLFWAFKKD